MREKEKEKRKKKAYFLYWKDILISFPSSTHTHTVLRTSLSRSHYYSIDYKQSFCIMYLSLQSLYIIREKKSERKRERKKTTTTIYTITNIHIVRKKDEKEEEEDASHVSKQHDSDNFLLTKMIHIQIKP